MKRRITPGWAGGCERGGSGGTPAGASGGFTLVELLTGLVLLGLLLLAVGQFAHGSLASYRGTMTLIERGQLERAARDVVIQEIGLAGYGQGFLGALDGPVLLVATDPRPERSDAFLIHYIDERWLQEPQRRSIHFDVARDAMGTWNLYRREEGATRQPAVQDVTNLKLVALIAEDGRQVPPDSAWPEHAAGLILRLSFDWGQDRLAVIGFGMPQRIGRM